MEKSDNNVTQAEPELNESPKTEVATPIDDNIVENIMEAEEDLGKISTTETESTKEDIDRNVVFIELERQPIVYWSAVCQKILGGS